MIHFFDSGQRNSGILIVDGTICFQHFIFGIDKSKLGILFFLLFLYFFKFLLQALLFFADGKAVYIVVLPVDCRNGEFSLGTDLHTLCIHIGG